MGGGVEVGEHGVGCIRHVVGGAEAFVGHAGETGRRDRTAHGVDLCAGELDGGIVADQRAGMNLRHRGGEEQTAVGVEDESGHRVDGLVDRQESAFLADLEHDGVGVDGVRVDGRRRILRGRTGGRGIPADLGAAACGRRQDESQDQDDVSFHAGVTAGGRCEVP